MSFKDVYNAVYNQLKDSSLLTYVNQDRFYKGFLENLPASDYAIIIEPGVDDDSYGGFERQSVGTTGSGGYTGNVREANYYIEIYARMIAGIAQVNTQEQLIVGKTGVVGLLDFVDDIKQSIRKDLTLGYSRYGSSVSEENASSTFALSSSQKYITVTINGNTPTGYNAVNCGVESSSGQVVASNIQTALNALGSHSDDGYYDAVCEFDSDTNQFTIRTDSYSPRCSVVVTAGGSNDCSALLGFDNPTELQGRNIVKVRFNQVQPVNDVFPVRYRLIPIVVTEEILDN